jgi:hypothetical protein
MWFPYAAPRLRRGKKAGIGPPAGLGSLTSPIRLSPQGRASDRQRKFAARSQLKWAREGDVWILLYRRRRMGRVVPDKNHPGMWRSVKVDGILSDTANLSWSKDNVMAQAIREVAWNAANYPQKCPVKRGSREQKSPPMRLNAA